MRFKKILLFFVFSLLLGCGNSNTAQDYIESGKSFYEKENYEKAKLEFRNAIQIDNKQADPYYHLALIFEKEQNWKGVYHNLSQVIQINPQHIDARLKLGGLFLLSKEYGEALEQINAILAIAENNLDALILKGVVLLGQEKFDEARAIADKVLSKDINNTKGAGLKAVLYLRQEKTSDALKIVESGLQNNSDDPVLNLLILDIYKQSKDFVAFEKKYLSLIKRFPETLKLSYDLAKYYSQNKKYDKALVILEDIINKNPDLLEPKLILIHLLGIAKSEQFEKTIKDYLLQMPKEAKLYSSLANFYLSQKKLLEGKEQLNLLIKNADDKQAKLEAKILLAKLAEDADDLTTAEALVDEVLAEDKRHLDGILLRTQFKLKKGLYDESVSDLRSVLKYFAESDEVVVLLAQAYMKKNLPELAEENYRKALELNPDNFLAMNYVVSKMIKNNNILRADKVLQSFLQKQPHHPIALQLLAKVKLSQQDWGGANKIVDLIAQEPKGVGFSKFIAGRILQEQGLYEKAIEQYKEALKLSPDLFDAMKSIMMCYEALNQREKTYIYFDAYIALYPDKPYAIALKVQLFMFDKNLDKALSVLTDATHKWPKKPVFYEGLATIFMLKKEPEKVILTYKKALENIPNSITLAMQLGNIYQQSQDYKSALEVYEKLIDKYPEFDRGINDVVSLLVNYFPTKENIERALGLATRFSDSEHVNFLDTYGWALFASNRYQDALEVFKKVVSKESKVAVFRYHLAKAHHKMNNSLEAIFELEQALKLSDKKGGFVEKADAIELLKVLKSS